MEYASAVAIAMFGWIPLVLVLFWRLPPRRAALVGFLLAWMFLPIAEFKIIHGLPPYTKMSATCGGVLLAIAIFDRRRLLGLRLKWADIPVMLFCLLPFVSSLLNGLGVHDGISAVFERTVTWGVPYAVGRLYFEDPAYLRELAMGMVCGGLLYVPFCLWERSNGTFLHLKVYGFPPIHLDPWPIVGPQRPIVFMQTSLMVSMWMVAATVLAVWLWKTRALPPSLRIWLTCLTPPLLITTILLYSVNGWILTSIGVGLLLVHSFWRSAAPLAGVVLAIFAFLFVRTTGLWSGEHVVPVVRTVIAKEKGMSIGLRLENENTALVKAQQRPVFGWGRQAHIFRYRDGSPVSWDSLWMIVFSQAGFAGLTALLGTILLPVALFVRRFPPSRWQAPDVAPAAALAVVLVLYMVDNLVNAMLNPVFMLAAGGLSGLRAPSAD
jgi:O-antigen ligase